MSVDDDISAWLVQALDQVEDTSVPIELAPGVTRRWPSCSGTWGGHRVHLEGAGCEVRVRMSHLAPVPWNVWLERTTDDGWVALQATQPGFPDAATPPPPPPPPPPLPWWRRLFFKEPAPPAKTGRTWVFGGWVTAQPVADTLLRPVLTNDAIDALDGIRFSFLRHAVTPDHVVVEILWRDLAIGGTIRDIMGDKGPDHVLDRMVTASTVWSQLEVVDVPDAWRPEPPPA